MYIPTDAQLISMHHATRDLTTCDKGETYVLQVYMPVSKATFATNNKQPTRVCTPGKIIPGVQSLMSYSIYC